MPWPRMSRISRMRRIGRYLLQYPWAAWRLRASAKGSEILCRVEAYSDSGRVGCRGSRTSGGRYFEVKFLWLQEAVKVGRVMVAKVKWNQIQRTCSRNRRARRR